ncbi:Transposase-like protein [Mycena venus]|uniref:Transposase-like protein n=1 Tax=Mycena venus TaxID=2733690 RepID=A0A8H6Z9S8_9AGAR|nr:Transposase-like protein [Mycena venus]
MPESLVKYEERPRSKSLPKCGTLFESRPEAVAFNWMKWLIVNIAVFLLPFASGLTAFLLLGSRLGVPHNQSSHDFVFFLAYMAISTGYRGRRIPWEKALGVYGVSELSHLQLNLVILGGGNQGQPTASSSRPNRTRNTTRIDVILEAERVDEDGNPENHRKPVKRKRPSKSKVKPVDSDPDDSDFETDENGNESTSSSDSDIEEILPNTELADSLPTKTVPEKSQRRRTEKPPRKKSKGRAKATDPPEEPITSTPPVPVQQPSVPMKPKVQKVRNAIYYFFEKVDANADGSVEEGARYYKCYLRNRKVFKIGRKMNYNTNGLQSHLRSHFLANYRLFKVLNSRDTPPTDVELALARGSMPMTPEKAIEYLAQLDSISNDIKEMFEKQAAASDEPWDQEHFKNLLAKWVAACDQPFSAVDAVEFRELLQYTHHPTRKALKIPHAKSIKVRIDKMGEEMVASLSEMFKENTSDFVLSLNAWTSSNGFAFLAIVIHYIGNNSKLEECLIDFRELIGEHSGENMAAAVWETIEKFGLIGRITAFVMDNATNNDILVEAFACRCRALGIPFSSRDARMRCMPDTIHLAALKLLEAIGALTKDEKKKAKSRSTPYQDAATESLSHAQDNWSSEVEDGEDDEVMKPTSLVGCAVFKAGILFSANLRKIVRHVRSSPQRRRSWQKEVRNCMESSPGTINSVLNLILDVKTRWSSTHQMLRRALQFREPIFNYVAKDSELREHELNAAEWDALQLVTQWLKMFRSATTQMSTTKQPMLSSTHAIFRGLQQRLKAIISELPESADPALKEGLVNAHRKLSDYFTKFDQSRYYSWAALLDPRISYESLREDYADDPEPLAELEISKINLQSHFKQHYAAATPAPPPAAESQSEPGSPQKVDFTSRYKKRGSAATTSDELAEYFRLTSVPEPFEVVDPLQWWYSRRLQFPQLYRLAHNVLCIPGSAVAVERIFSGGRDTIGLRRASLKAETIETLMFVKARLRLARKAIIDLTGDEDDAI